MKTVKFAFFATIALLLMACKKDSSKGSENIGITGRWKLVEVYADPGDGSGKYGAVDSKKQLTFKANGTVEVQNGDLCTVSINSDNNATSTYKILDKSETSGNKNRLVIFSCAVMENAPSELTFEIKGDILTISYLCFEGCGERYKRIE
ncbi:MULTISPECIES: lipocalin family protein [unclassified Sphingobacterium]|uniref:lipocalin family protein n=1 Tax=unclassified Sphingobacterium TaxID=2609468 RepID=UPI0025E01128|nr:MULTISPECIES: lipocalin family protein [unclassified Sphingobacterium]